MNILNNIKAWRVIFILTAFFANDPKVKLSAKSEEILSFEADVVLIATGRLPNTQNLGLDTLAYVDIFYTRPRPILTRDLLIDSSMQIIHTYVNRLRGRMDDVTDMLF